jgi:hypothetical protein
MHNRMVGPLVGFGFVATGIAFTFIGRRRVNPRRRAVTNPIPRQPLTTRQSSTTTTYPGVPPGRLQ